VSPHLVGRDIEERDDRWGQSFAREESLTRNERRNFPGVHWIHIGLSRNTSAGV